LVRFSGIDMTVDEMMRKSRNFTRLRWYTHRSWSIAPIKVLGAAILTVGDTVV